MANTRGAPRVGAKSIVGDQETFWPLNSCPFVRVTRHRREALARPEGAAQTAKDCGSLQGGSLWNVNANCRRFNHLMENVLTTNIALPSPHDGKDIRCVERDILIGPSVILYIPVSNYPCRFPSWIKTAIGTSYGTI